MSVAMLSLVAIIFSAAVRTEIWAPTGTSMLEPTALPLSVTVNWSSQDTVPALIASDTA